MEDEQLPELQSVRPMITILERWDLVFRDVALEILLASGYAIASLLTYKTRKMDRILTDPNGEIILAHFYHYDFRDVDAKVIHNASSHLYQVMANHKIQSGALIFSARRPASISSHWKSEGISIRHLGVMELQSLAAGKPDIRDKFDNYLHRRGVELIGDTLRYTNSEPFDPSKPFIRGRELADRLDMCGEGKADPQGFEAICSEAVALLFESQIERHDTQFKIDDGLSKIDHMLTLNTRAWSGFWKDLGTFFRCRYVVVEFKNYKDPIGQDEIVSTARYLNPLALRSVALIIARNGEAKNGALKRKQLLRSEGRVILVIDASELKSMLTAFDEGGDPSEILGRKLHAALTELSL